MFGSVSWWKFRREVSTLTRRVIYLLFLRPFEPVINSLYDRFSTRLLSVKKHFDGSGGQKVAVYLLYQPAGLSNTTFSTITALKAKGFLVMVISNAKLHEEDIGRLSEEACFILERPNYGVDFGGYRDAVRYLRKSQFFPDELLFLNDSVLCLVGDFGGFITSIGECSQDVIGAVELKSGQRAEPLLTSYFVVFRRAALTHPAFIEFWDSYRMANSRYTTVRRGERALSRMIKASGLSSRGMIGVEGNWYFVVNALSTRDLELSVRYCALTDSVFVSWMTDILTDANGAHEEDRRTFFSDFIKKVAARRSLVASFPYLVHAGMKMPIQKKGSTLLQRLAVARFADAIEDGFVTSLNAEAAEEIQRLKTRYLNDPVNATVYRHLVEAAGSSSLMN